MIKYNNSNINDWDFGTSNIVKVYLNNAVCYQKVEGGSTPPTPPTPTAFKWKATYTGGTVSSAGCDSTSAITDGEITKINLVSVEIGDCVTTLGGYVFDSCPSLTSLTLPNSLTTIGNEVFQDCSSLTSLTIPEYVSIIEFWAFSRMTSCQEVIFENPTVFDKDDGFAPFHDWYPPVVYVPDESVSAYRSKGIYWWIDGDDLQIYPDINTWIQPISNR